MRTTAEAQPSAAQPAAGRARSPAGPEPPRQPPVRAAAVSVTTVRMLRVEEGLYALQVGRIAGSPGEVAGMPVPAAQVAAPFAEDGSGVEIVASFPRRGGWLGREGGTLILRSPAGGGHLLVTAYGGAGQPTQELALDLQRLDAASPAAAAPEPPPARPAAEPAAELTAMRDIPTEILLHIERAGDRLFPGRGWVGALGRRMRIEAFSVRPLERLTPAEIEMKAFMPNGGETPWIPGGVLCGTRGRGLPLVGFAVRIAPQRADRFEVQYQGSFFAGGISEMHRDGDPCRSASPDDPLEAINIRVIETVAGPAAGAGGA
jgi:hypothetical protein